jgi:hypothetical protein
MSSIESNNSDTLFNKIDSLPELLYEDEANGLYGLPAKGSLAQSFQREMADLSDKMVDELNAVFDDTGVSVDLSEDSLTELDDLAGRLWPEACEDEDSIAALGANWGAYLGEVILENIGGEWVFREDLEHSGIYFPRTGLVVFPLHKVQKRMALGESHNLSDFYAAIIDELTQD